jgi:hypothetical protein
MDNDILLILIPFICLGVVVVVLKIMHENEQDQYMALALERELLAEYFEHCSPEERTAMLGSIEEFNPELYESWINVPYPSPGDYVWHLNRTSVF